MARSLNQVTLLGNITRDPELRTTPGGASVVSMSLALNRSYKDQAGTWQEATDYVDIVCWGPLAERCSQYLAKGSKVLVQGRIQSRNWEKDGKKFSKVEIVASDVTFLDQRKENQTADRPVKEDEVIEDIGDEPINLDDIPF